MSIRGFSNLVRPIQNFAVAYPKINQPNIYRTSNEISLIQGRFCANRCVCKEEKEAKESLEKRCPNATCPKRKRGKGFFAWLFGSPEEKIPDPDAVCRRVYNENLKCRTVPDLSIFGGKAFKTCGEGAYIIQKNNLPVEEETTSKEDLLIKKMEAPMGGKHEIIDLIPSFRSVEQRLLDLQDRKLHPFYKKYQGLSKKPPTQDIKDLYLKYVNINLDKLAAEEIPKRIKFNKELLEKKNMYSEFKKVEPPKQIIGRILEMEANQRPTMEKKPPAPPICREVRQVRPKEKQVFDTLEQKGDLF